MQDTRSTLAQMRSVRCPLLELPGGTCNICQLVPVANGASRITEPNL